MGIFSLDDCSVVVDSVEGCAVFDLDNTELKIVDLNTTEIDLFSDYDCQLEIFVPGPPGPPGPGATVKAGLVPGASFSGSPKTYAVVFAVPYTDLNYVISITGVDARNFTYMLKSQNGFTINANASQALAGEVSWIATPVGDA